jgi:hypothetical protein
MSLLDHPAVYDDLLDVLAESADAERLRTFRLSEAHQARLDALLSEISFMGMGAIHPDHQVLKMHHAYWQRNFVPESLHLPDLQR